MHEVFLPKIKLTWSLLYLFSIDDASIECNCDDEKTGITDNNLLTSKNQLPVTGRVCFILAGSAFFYFHNVKFTLAKF